MWIGAQLPIIVPPKNQIWVSPYGNDSTGNGSAASPFATIGKATAAIISYADNSGTNPYVIRMMAGVYTETVSLLPWVWLVGDVLGGPTPQYSSAPPALQSACQIVGTADTDPSWNQANQRGGMANLYCVNEQSIHQQIGATGMVLDLINFSSEALSFIARDALGGVNWLGGACFDGTLVNGNHIVANVMFGLEHNCSSSIGFSGGIPQVQYVACKFVANATMHADTSQFLNVRFTACDIPEITIDGAGCIATFDCVSYPTSAPPTLASGGQFVLRTPATSGLYSPAAPSDWAATPPATVQAALDRLVAVQITPP
jgi:hypothetical protein